MYTSCWYGRMITSHLQTALWSLLDITVATMTIAHGAYNHVLVLRSLVSFYN